MMKSFPGKCIECGRFINVQPDEELTKCPYCGSVSKSEDILHEFDQALSTNQYHLKTESQWRGTVLHYLKSMMEKVNTIADVIEYNEDMNEEFDFDDEEYDELQEDDEEDDFGIIFDEEENVLAVAEALEQKHRERGDDDCPDFVQPFDLEDDYVYTAEQPDSFGAQAGSEPIDFDDPEQVEAFRLTLKADRMTPQIFQMEAFALHGYLWNKKNRCFEKGDSCFGLREFSEMLEHELTDDELNDLILYLALLDSDEFSKPRWSNCFVLNHKMHITYTDKEHAQEQIASIRTAFLKELWDNANPEELAYVYPEYYGKTFAKDHKYRVSVVKTKNPHDFRVTGFFDTLPVDIPELPEDTELELIFDVPLPVITRDMIASIKNVTCLTISGDIGEIGEYAFADHDTLKKVYIENVKLHKIGSKAFKGCTALKNYCSRSEEEISPDAFEDCPL